MITKKEANIIKRLNRLFLSNIELKGMIEVLCKRKIPLFEQSLNNIDLRGSNLRGIVFDGSWLENVDFRGADLRGARFKMSCIEGADFRRAKLKGAIFENTEVKETNFKDTSIDAVTFSAQCITDVISLTEALDIEKASFVRSFGKNNKNQPDIIRGLFNIKSAGAEFSLNKEKNLSIKKISYH